MSNLTLNESIPLTDPIGVLSGDGMQSHRALLHAHATADEVWLGVPVIGRRGELGEKLGMTNATGSIFTGGCVVITGRFTGDRKNAGSISCKKLKLKFLGNNRGKTGNPVKVISVSGNNLSHAQ